MIIEGMAERYGMLPSQILREGTTVDLIYFDTALSYRNYLSESKKGKIPKNSVNQEDLQRRMEQVRNK